MSSFSPHKGPTYSFPGVFLYSFFGNVPDLIRVPSITNSIYLSLKYRVRYLLSLLNHNQDPDFILNLFYIFSIFSLCLIIFVTLIPFDTFNIFITFNRDLHQTRVTS